MLFTSCMWHVVFYDNHPTWNEKYWVFVKYQEVSTLLPVKKLPVNHSSGVHGSTFSQELLQKSKLTTCSYYIQNHLLGANGLVCMCCLVAYFWLPWILFSRQFLQKERKGKSLTRTWMHLKPLWQDMSGFWMNTARKCEQKIMIFHFMRSLKSLGICGASYPLSKNRYNQ